MDITPLQKYMAVNGNASQWRAVILPENTAEDMQRSSVCYEDDGLIYYKFYT
jgi:hypothetical protein